MYLMYILKGFEEILVRLLILAVLGPCCRAGFPLAVAMGGYTEVAVRGLLVVAASLLVEQRL